MANRSKPAYLDTSQSPWMTKVKDICDIPDTAVASKRKVDDSRLVSPTARKRNTKTSSSIIDLTGGKEPTPLFLIKNKHPLFFTYDPRGTKKIKTMGIDYCKYCLCPKKYCAEEVYGKMTSKRTLHLMKLEGLDDYDDDDDIKEKYASVYTMFVKSKMMWNNISFKRFDEDDTVRIPGCMERGSLSYLYRDVEKKREAEADAVWDHDSLDLTKKELDNFVASVVPGRGVKEVPEEEKGSDSVSDEVDVKARTVIEQASDIGPMFKLMKKKLKEYTTADI
jgi:hypothetical protein